MAWKNRNRPALTGQLLPLAGPDGVALPLPWALERKRRRRVTLGRNATWPAWRLPGWEGQAHLRAQPSGGVLFSLARGAAQVNGQPVRADVRLADGDTIACSDYRIRYENLLV